MIYEGHLLVLPSLEPWGEKTLDQDVGTLGSRPISGLGILSTHSLRRRSLP